jgi:endoglucanase
VFLPLQTLQRQQWPYRPYHLVLRKPALQPTGITLSWTASTDSGGPGLGGYYLYRYTTSAGASTAIKIASPSASTTLYVDSGLSPGTSYSYYLEAYDTSSPVNVSAASTTLAASTQALILPSVPTGLTRTGASAYTILLSWTASTDSGGPGVGGYYLFRNGTKIATIAAPTTTYIDTGLTISTTYSYYLESYDTANPANVSAASSTSNYETSTILGDIDGDDSVTGHDLSILLSNYGKNYPPAEFDGVSTVEGHDLSILLSNYGK